ncbi:MAG TPA: DUF4255 domain-containing protein [Kofleriaceae bacterium]
MLDVALNFLTTELNAYLVARGARKSTDEIGKAEVGKLVDDAGKWVISDDHIGVSLIHIEEDRVMKSQLPEAILARGRQVILEPALKLNLHILFAAKFQKYDEGLRSLSLVLTYFQSHPTFTPDTYSGLDPRIERLTVELQPLSYEQLNQIWTFVGAKQLPSVIYKVRMVALQDLEPTAVAPPVSEIQTAATAT